MSKLWLLTAFLITGLIGFTQKDPVILTINDKEVRQSEFLQVYLKNNNDPKFDKASLDEYMKLYKNFKLKVAEAEMLGYDTIPSLVRELEGYKKQLARPYLVDSLKNLELVKEAYERMKYEIDASHILIRVAEKADPTDTLKAYNKIMALKKRIQNGEDFVSVASGKDGSEDPSVADNKGRLGYFTAFQMVYPFESIAYNTPVGEVGGPIRTSYGYHLVKVHNKRPARGAMTTSHIMIAVRRDADKDDIKNAEKKAWEIHQKLVNGEDFTKMVNLYSDDKGTKQKGGKLPTFGTGTNQRMIPEFEDVAFSLEEDFAFSEPFQTDFGFHIVRRLDYTPFGTFEELEKSIKSKVNRGDRGQSSQRSFISKLKSENKFKENRKKGLKWFNENVDSTIFRGKWEAPDMKKDKWLFRYAGKRYMASEFASYLEEKQKPKKKMSIPIFIDEQFTKWQEEMILAHEEASLADKYPEYRALVNEYHDGVLLYEIMKDLVWDKAVQDTSGVEAFFEQNRDKYYWEDRIDADIYSTSKRDIAEKTFNLLQTNDSISPKEVVGDMNANSQLNIAVKSERFLVSNLTYLEGRNIKEGLNPTFEHEGTFYIINLKEKLPSMPKELHEARGAVIQDYQNFLEENWLNELRKRHKITVNENVLYGLGK